MQDIKQLFTKKPIILDGGMGQELVRRLVTKPDRLWSAQILMEFPHLVEELHYEFIEAGCDVITLATYPCTLQRLESEGKLDLFDELHKNAIAAAENARNKASERDIAIAGCLPPLVRSYSPETAPEFEKAVESYMRIVNAQKDHVDLFICETMSSIHEAQSAVAAAKTSGLPIWVAFRLNDDDPDYLQSGELFSKAISEIEKLSIDALLLNCARPETIKVNLEELKKFSGLTGIYPNGFTNITSLQESGTVEKLERRKDLNPEQYAAFMKDAFKQGIDILGGCCEVTPEHIAKIFEM